MTFHVPKPVRALAAAALAALATAASGAGIPVLTHGDRIDLRQHLEPGRAVLFDFYADWCGPCRSLSPEIERLAAANADRLTVRKIDIVRWGSPVAEQYAIRGIPHLKLFGPDGRLVSEGLAGPVLSELERLLPTLKPGAAPSGSGPAVAIADHKPAVPFYVFLLGVVALGGVVAFLAGVGRRAAPAAAGAPLRPIRPTARAAPPADDRGWFVYVAGNVEGPFTAAEMERMRRAGQLPAGTPIRHRNDPDWRTVGG
jgi:thiol-disulfide isomerase/thioredoxin